MLFTQKGYSQFNPGATNSTYEETETPLESPPHNGAVKQAGRYYIEVVTNWFATKNNTTIYLLKTSGKPIPNEAITCTVKTKMDDKEEVQKVIHRGFDGFYVHLDATKAYVVEISFQVKKKVYTASFQTKGNSN